ncbi:MAG: molybdate ABC transporter permease subunit [Gammaproteobacteria bacterium]|nr:MAG: molybdate ABC transporter permease subunit [Gammaproteobacteria bacterium]
MDWSALKLSLLLSAWTSLVLIVVGLGIARTLAWRQFPGKSVVESLVTLPLVLPPTVLGFYLLTLFSNESWLGRSFVEITGDTLAFSFFGLLVASVIYSLPFAVQPMLRGFESIPKSYREAAWCSGLSNWETFRRVELPLAWPGVVSGIAMSFAHTMGEFGVVLMVGGNIPGETRTISIAIYDRTQALDNASANSMSLVLLVFALCAISLVYALNRRLERRDE